MDVFISWSGPQSKQVAEALYHYLPLMINAIQPWLSSADIEAGARWATDIAGKLQQSKVGIICLTPSNLESIWIHFEAGALAKTLENTFVCPYLLGIEPSNVKGPLTQFQAKRANEDDTRRLIETLNAALGEAGLKPEQLGEAFSVWWPKLKQKLDAIEAGGPAPEKRSTEDMLEELLELARRQARNTPEPMDSAREVRARAKIMDLSKAIFPTAGMSVRQINDEYFIAVTPQKAPTFTLRVGEDVSPDSLLDRLNAMKLAMTDIGEEPPAE